MSDMTKACRRLGIHHRHDDGKTLKRVADMVLEAHRFAAQELAQRGNEPQHLHRGGERTASGRREAI